jgi:hypothetical protein
MSKNTTSKYMLVLQHIYAQRTFNPRQTVREFKISNNFLTAGKEIGLFKRVGESEYAWTLDRPALIKDAQDIQVRVRSYTQTHRLKSKSKTQLTIKPIRKAPAPTSMPVVHEVECDNSNSKMLLIMAVGLVIGFLIATAIWK